METQTKEKVVGAEWLEQLGFSRAAKDLKDLLSRQRKLALAYEHYRYVTPERVNEFNAKLMKETGKNLNSMANMEYQTLAFVNIKEYERVPPESVLKNLQVAQDRKCFDSFEVAYIKNVKDPLLFGKIERCPNFFFVDQWDDDISIDQLIKANEG